MHGDYAEMMLRLDEMLIQACKFKVESFKIRARIIVKSFVITPAEMED